MKIGVFDSGIGGLSVARALEAALPDHEIIFMDDQQHMPYGTKSPDEVYALAEPILQNLVDRGCAIIVIACNTVTTTLIGRVRQAFDVPFVAIEPMVKPAAEQTRSGVIAVCATPATLSSERYARLKQEFAAHIQVLEPDCADWAAMIEHKTIDEQAIAARIEDVIRNGGDVIVLGCTHYHWIEETVKRIARGRAAVLQPEQAIVARVRQVLADLPA